MRIVIDTTNPTNVKVDQGGSYADAALGLSGVTRGLERRMRSHTPVGYGRGKTRMRDEVMDMLGCSALRAEHVVDAMVARGYASFRRHGASVGDARYGLWSLQPTP